MRTRVTPPVLARLRLAAQLILPTSIGPAQGPVEVVRRLTALQGQDFPGALWSIGLRAPGSTRAAVEEAFNRGELVRSWPMRGTLHVTLAQDLGWILSITRERMISALASRHRELDITTPDVEKVRELAISLLEQSGGRASRDALLTEFDRAGQPVKAQRGIHLLFMLCLQGTLLQGPMNTAAGNGNTQFFVRSEQWVKNPRVLEREQALAELCLRYFRSHGPATLKDFQWWSKLPLKDIKTGLAQVSSELESVECNGEIYWLAPETAVLLDGTIPGARSVLLLPGFDEYLLGYTDRSAALAPEHAPLTVPGNNGMFKATVVTGGKVAGTWRKAQGAAEKQRQLAGVVLPEFFGQLSPNQHKALEQASKKYAAFLTP